MKNNFFAKATAKTWQKHTVTPGTCQITSRVGNRVRKFYVVMFPKPNFLSAKSNHSR